MNEYKYMLVDASYFLTRNFMASRYSNGFCKEVLFRSFFWSIGKFKRDFHTADKIILAWDKWSPQYNGYYRNTLIEEYKADRYYHNEEDLNKLKEEGKSPEEIKEYEEQLRLNGIKQATKWMIIDHMGKFGVPSLMKSGFEADDIAKVFCDYLEKDDRKSCIVTKDSDWSYLINPNVDYIYGKDGVVTTYEGMLEYEHHIPEEFGISLYDLKAVYDSIYSSHNHMIGAGNKERLKRVPFKKVLESVLQSDPYYLDNVDLFKANISTFDIDKFPEIEKLRNMMYFLDKNGSISPTEDFVKFTQENNIDMTADYYNKFVSGLETKFYSQN